MTKTQKIRYLLQYRYINQDIDRTIQELNKIKNIKSLSGYRAKYLEDHLKLRVDEMTEIRIRLDKAVSKLDDPTLREILILRYQQGMTYKQIGEQISLNMSYVAELHSKAISMIELEV